MLNESCVPVLLKALEKICAADMLDKTAEDCVLSATRVFQRLLKSNSNQDRVTRASQGGSNSAELRLKVRLARVEDAPLQQRLTL